MATILPKSLTTAAGDPFVVRSAQPEDAGRFLEYIRAVARETRFFVIEPDELPATEAEEARWIQSHLDQPAKLVLAAEAAGEIVGSLSFENGPFRRTSHAGTLGLSVRRDWRGKGIGTAMLAALLEWAERSPLIEKVGLAVFSSNARAICLYRRLGFFEEGRRAKAIKVGHGEHVDEVLMGRFVKPWFSAIGTKAP